MNTHAREDQEKVNHTCTSNSSRLSSSAPPASGSFTKYDDDDIAWEGESPRLGEGDAGVARYRAVALAALRVLLAREDLGVRGIEPGIGDARRGGSTGMDFILGCDRKIKKPFQGAAKLQSRTAMACTQSSCSYGGGG